MRVASSYTVVHWIDQQLQSFLPAGERLKCWVGEVQMDGKA